MLSFSCNDKRDWEEPGHFKFLNALQEGVGNNLISHPYEHSQNLPVVEGGMGTLYIVNSGGGGWTIYPMVKCPPLNPHVCNDKRDWEEPGHFKFLNALQEGAGNNLISHPYEHSQNLPVVEGDTHIVNSWGGGAICPIVKCPPPQPSCMLSFLCNDKRDWEEPGHFKFLNALQEGAGNNLISHPYEHSQNLPVVEGDTLHSQ